MAVICFARLFAGPPDAADLEQLRRDQELGVQEVRQAQPLPAVLPRRSRAVQAGPVPGHDHAPQRLPGGAGRPRLTGKGKFLAVAFDRPLGGGEGCVCSSRLSAVA